MKILALEFSTNERSVAVAASEGTILGAIRESDYRGVTGMTLIDRGLKQAGVQAGEISMIVVGLGPGSYTGVRSAIAIAQGWQLGRDVKLAGISSVRCLAEEAKREGIHGSVRLIVDAQRGEVYTSLYRISPEAAVEVEPLQIVSPSALGKEELIAGPDASKFVSEARNLTPSAEALCHLASSAWLVPGETLEPIYLRQTTFVKASAPRQII